MDIVWLGHSAVRMQSRGVTLITDPYDETLGFPMPAGAADIVTVSNDHPHHSHHGALEGEPRVLTGPGEYEVGNFHLSGMGTRRERPDSERQINTVFTIRAEGLTLCHLGDIDQRLSPTQVQELNQTDVLFVPAGGVCTVSASAAAELVNLIRPRIVVPIHYRVDGVAVELEPVEGFLGAMGIIGREARASLSVTQSSLPRELTVVVLKVAT